MGALIRFSEFEDEAIKALYTTFTDKEIGEVLERCKNSITTRRFFLNLRKLEPYTREPEIKVSYSVWCALSSKQEGYYPNDYCDELEAWSTPLYLASELLGEEREILNKPLKKGWELNHELWKKEKKQQRTTANRSKYTL